MLDYEHFVITNRKYTGLDREKIRPELWKYFVFLQLKSFRAWVKKTDSELEAAAKAAQAEEDKDIPILPYSSLFILSSENK